MLHVTFFYQIECSQSKLKAQASQQVQFVPQHPPSISYNNNYNFVTFITHSFFLLQINDLQTLCTDCPHSQNRNIDYIVPQTRRNDTSYVILEFLVIL